MEKKSKKIQNNPGIFFLGIFFSVLLHKKSRKKSRKESKKKNVQKNPDFFPDFFRWTQLKRKEIN